MLKRFVIALITLYQKYISPLFGPRCRFYPTCSAYGKTAIEKYGLFYGLWLLTKRLIKCNPFHRGGYDPVP